MFLTSLCVLWSRSLLFIYHFHCEFKRRCPNYDNCIAKLEEKLLYVYSYLSIR